ncbi:hypothetical protein SCHPADRAFT_829062 [Schizopora paradoxa]|uniref:F-box domain-containing protein n=1 Tax=Schizopora paradoxa TaxID=27342 RepID=A0A0H2RLD8_9AGAM|nr:hypothetical protein SCHPADRAFT_829062 [Schizopora paradoxa]
MAANANLNDTLELAQFREQWRAEVQQRRKDELKASPEAQAQPSYVSGSEQSHVNVETVVSPVYPPEETGQVILKEPSYAGPTYHSPVARESVPEVPARKFPDFQFTNALVAYRAAVQAEQRGALDDAVQYYRQAFRLDSFVDKAYFKEERRLTQQIAAISGKDREHAGNDADSLQREIDSLESNVGTLSLQTGGNGGSVASGTLASIISGFPEQLSFEPEDQLKKCFLSSLSEELLLLILRYLDSTSIERFALADRKARLVSLDSEIWRSFSHSIYFYPQVPADFTMKDAIRKYHNDYRRLYIEQPRIRLDGVYIAVCHYVYVEEASIRVHCLILKFISRAGYSENLWVQTSHLITYHRYLRFFPDGRVICLRANEDQSPQTIIPQLRSTPTLDLKDMSIGRWRLDGTTVLITDIKYIHEGNPRHTFQMCLALKSRPVGRWNRLDFLTFDSVHPETGEAESLPLKNERSFWFSKVRSYL